MDWRRQSALCVGLISSVGMGARMAEGKAVAKAGIAAGERLEFGRPDARELRPVFRTVFRLAVGKARNTLRA